MPEIMDAHSAMTGPFPKAFPAASHQLRAPRPLRDRITGEHQVARSDLTAGLKTAAKTARDARARSSVTARPVMDTSRTRPVLVVLIKMPCAFVADTDRSIRTVPASRSKSHQRSARAHPDAAYDRLALHPFLGVGVGPPHGGADPFVTAIEVLLAQEVAQPGRLIWSSIGPRWSRSSASARAGELVGVAAQHVEQTKAEVIDTSQLEYTADRSVLSVTLGSWASKRGRGEEEAAVGLEHDDVGALDGGRRLCFAHVAVGVEHDPVDPHPVREPDDVEDDRRPLRAAPRTGVGSPG